MKFIVTKYVITQMKLFVTNVCCLDHCEFNVHGLCIYEFYVLFVWTYLAVILGTSNLVKIYNQEFCRFIIFLQSICP